MDPTVAPVQHARRKVPIGSKGAIKEAIDYMVQQDILEPQIKPIPWVSSVTYPVKPTGEVRPCLSARDLNKTILRENHKPQTVLEIAHQLARVVVFTKTDALKVFLQVNTEASSKLLMISTQRKVLVQDDAIWDQDVTGCLPDEDGPHHGEMSRHD